MWGPGKPLPWATKSMQVDNEDEKHCTSHKTVRIGFHHLPSYSLRKSVIVLWSRKPENVLHSGESKYWKKNGFRPVTGLFHQNLPYWEVAYSLERSVSYRRFYRVPYRWMYREMGFRVGSFSMKKISFFTFIIKILRCEVSIPTPVSHPHS